MPKASKPEKPAQPQDSAAEAGVTKAPGLGDGYSLGLNLMVSILVGLAMGYGLDRWLGTTPWLLLLFMVLGFAAGLRQIWLALQRS